MEKQVNAIVKTVITTDKEGMPLVKKRADGSFSRYDLVSAEVTGTNTPLDGQLVWAQRTLENRDKEAKEAVVEGQEVLLYATVVDGKPFFTVATGNAVANDADIMLHLFGVTAPATVATPADAPSIL
jgi:hypothetical protein